MIDFTFDLLLVLAAAGFVAGFIDAIAGGGGLITVPALLLAGLGPVEALGTNKFQALFGSGIATFTYMRKGLVDPRRQSAAFVLALVGAVAGALLASVAPTDLLRTLLPFLLIAIAVYFALKPKLSDIDQAERLRPATFLLIVPPAIGFYDGFFGPGTGSFFMIAYVALAGYGVLKATAHTKTLNFASNVGGFIAFAAVGAVVWPIGLVMGAAQLVGSWLGALLAVRVGSRLIKPLLIVVSIVLAIRLLFEDAFS